MATAVFGSAVRAASGRLLVCAKPGGSGIRRRLNATARHVKAADYVGQASRRYQSPSAPALFLESAIERNDATIICETVH